jgi:hypothetical protein
LNKRFRTLSFGEGRVKPLSFSQYHTQNPWVFLGKLGYFQVNFTPDIIKFSIFIHATPCTLLPALCEKLGKTWVFSAKYCTHHYQICNFHIQSFSQSIIQSLYKKQVKAGVFKERPPPSLRSRAGRQA